MADQEPNTTGPENPASTVVTPDAPTVPSTGESAPSPSATPPEPSGDTRAELLAAVQQAVPELRSSQDDESGQGGAPPAPSETPDPNAPPPPISPEQLPDEPTAEELAATSPKTRARIQNLLDQRRELRSRVEQFEASSPLVEAARATHQYLIANDIGEQDYKMLLELGAAMRRGDMKAFYTGVQPYVQLAEEALGIRLPADLQQAVQQGQMTTQAAQLFSQERFQRALAQSNGMRSQQQFQQSQQRTQEDMQQQANAQLKQAVEAKVLAWEEAMTRTDPDYQRLKPLLHQMLWSVVHERGQPQSPDQAVEIAKETYARTKAAHATFVPQQRRPTARVPSSTGRTNGAAPEPTSLRDVVTRALAESSAQ